MLRVVNRFQKVAGFDRSIALASSALTATIPLAILTSAVSSQLGGKGTADRIIERYDLTGGGAEAVKDIFSPASGTSTSLGVVGFLFLLVAVLSFTRAVQRLFEQTWELSPLSVRNTFNGLLWIGGLTAYLGLTGLLHAALGRSRLDLTATLLDVPAVGASSWAGPAGCSAPSGSGARRWSRSRSSARCRSRCTRWARRSTCRTSSARTPPATA